MIWKHFQQCILKHALKDLIVQSVHCVPLKANVLLVTVLDTQLNKQFNKNA